MTAGDEPLRPGDWWWVHTWQLTERDGERSRLAVEHEARVRLAGRLRAERLWPVGVAEASWGDGMLTLRVPVRRGDVHGLT